jgi:putative hydrolase of the HAD superfamily
VSVRLVLFDLDGTLVDHDAASAAAVRSWVANQGWGTIDDVPGHIAAWEEIAERHFPARRAGETTFLEQRRLRLRDFLPRVGIDPSGWSASQLDEAFAGYRVEYERAWSAYPDAAPCLAALGQLARVGVLSNGDQAQQEDKLRRTGLLDLAGRVVTSDFLGVAKPSPEAFRRACDASGVPVEQAVYVGDRLDVDAEAAAAAGLRGVWLDRLDRPEQTSLERITTLRDLPALLVG